MMLEIILSNRFKKDLKIIKKRGYDLDLLDVIVNQLAAEEPLADKHHDHSLVGDYAGFRECHILPDWLLVYRIDAEAIFLLLSRTGTHSDLFK